MAYIDGFSVYHGIRQWPKVKWLDVDALARLLGEKEGALVRVKYFTAMVHPTSDDPDKPHRQARYNAALRSRPDVRIIFGSYKPRWPRCKFCKRTYKTYQEKQTDVNIAMEILIDAYENRFDTLMLLSRDGDLVGPLKTMRRLFPQKRIILASPPGNASPDLPRCADAHIHITRTHFNKCQLPDAVATGDGRTVHRPDEWK